MQGVTLDTIGSGALSELFQAELAKVLANIADPNTDEKGKRTISIQVIFKPDARDVAHVELKCTSKIASLMTVRTQVFMGKQQGKLIAVEHDPRQSNLFDQQKPTLAAVASFTKDGE